VRTRQRWARMGHGATLIVTEYETEYRCPACGNHWFTWYAYQPGIPESCPKCGLLNERIVELLKGIKERKES